MSAGRKAAYVVIALGFGAIPVIVSHAEEWGLDWRWSAALGAFGIGWLLWHRWTGHGRMAGRPPIGQG